MIQYNIALDIVRYYTREAGLHAVNYIGSTKLDNRIIRVDWDAGFCEGRQYGRGKSGGQVSSTWSCNGHVMCICW